MQISPAKKEKIKANLGKREFVAELHPRYPKGHPKAGKFMPKGGADYVNAVAKDTGKTPTQVKASLGSDGGVKTKAQTTAQKQSAPQGKRDYKDAFPPEVVKEIQASTKSLGEALSVQYNAEQAKLNAVKGTKREAGKAFTAAKKEVSAKQKAVEAVLIKHGASKEKAREIAEKLIAKKVGQVKDGAKPVEKTSVKSTEKATVTSAAKEGRKKLEAFKQGASKPIQPSGSLVATPDEKTTQTQKKAVVQIREKDLEEKRSALVKQYGKELVNKAESNIQRIINENDVMIRVDQKVVDSILADGKLLNSSEVVEKALKANPKAYQDTEYQAERKQYEESAMGIPINTPSSGRPIYAYAGNTADMNSVHQTSVGDYGYGDVAFKLNPNIKNTASITSDDSFYGGLSSSANRFNAGSFSYGDTKDIGDRLNAAANSKSIDDVIKKTKSNYLEYQIHGGVKANDITEMHFTNGTQPTKSTVEWAKKNGVKIFTYD